MENLRKNLFDFIEISRNNYNASIPVFLQSKLVEKLKYAIRSKTLRELLRMKEMHRKKNINSVAIKTWVDYTSRFDLKLKVSAET